MKVKLILFVIILLAIIAVNIAFIIYVYKLKKPKPGIPCKVNQPTWNWDSSCNYIEETSFDESLKSPSNLRPYLVGFQFSQGAGNSIFLPCWYRFRYVNVKTGGYSEFSDWCSYPVLSGGCKLPCPGGNCGNYIKQGYYSCGYNQPILGISTSSSQYNPLAPQTEEVIYINLHRYVSPNPENITPPDPDVQDEIVGLLLPTQNFNGQKYYTCVDVLNNPCKSGCQTPKQCYQQNYCS